MILNVFNKSEEKDTGKDKARKLILKKKLFPKNHIHIHFANENMLCKKKVSILQTQNVL